MRSEDDRQPARVCAELAFRDVRGEFLGIGAAAIASDLVSGDLEEAQRASSAVASRIPLSLGARITVRDINLVAGLAGLPVDKAAQTIEIRFGHAEKRRRMLRPGADQADEPGRNIFAHRRDGRGARLSGSFRRGGLAAGSERKSEQGDEDAATRNPHAAGSTISALSSPSRGA